MNLSDGNNSHKNSLSLEDVTDTDIYRDVWLPLDQKEKDIFHLLKRGPIEG